MTPLPTARSLYYKTMEKKIDKKTKEYLDEFVGYAVGEGSLDIDMAKEMSYKDKLNYFHWSEVMSNEKGD